MSARRRKMSASNCYSIIFNTYDFELRKSNLITLCIEIIVFLIYTTVKHSLSQLYDSQCWPLLRCFSDKRKWKNLLRISDDSSVSVYFIRTLRKRKSNAILLYVGCTYIESNGRILEFIIEGKNIPLWLKIF